ncbi:hypothetical protein Clacol_008600 [Clathrus columnatus]|uniref:Fungal lipase-type domain-containing protein n=1 Tax=Clathrus columnatus TaxID=1419009 RepID=A0AAV5AN78_9AGAM|nr:hypothetical protein Clacol_008600 [Clathrus columnatus]
MSDIADFDFNRLKREIMKRHLEQLHKLDLFVSSKPDPHRGGDIPTPSEAYEKSEIDLNNAFLALMESIAVIFRDDSLVKKAADAYRSNKDSDKAFRLLEASVSWIVKLQHPDGKQILVGPFCGAFVPKDYRMSDKSWIGISFKGTGPGEQVNDIAAVPPTSAGDRLWGSHVGSGFFYPLFSSYEQGTTPSPFDMIQEVVREYTNRSKTTMTCHVTGHSLGGAYATLTYAELTIKGVSSPKAIIGDLYAYGAPRVGLEDFAIAAKGAVHSDAICKGSSWRIINNNDLVPNVPLIPLFPFSPNPFIHIDYGYKTYPNKTPELKPSEIGTSPEWCFCFEIGKHLPQEYYNSLVYAMTGKPAIEDGAVAVKWGGLSVAQKIPKEISFQKKVEVECTFASNNGCITGTMMHESFVGNITASGSFANPKMEGKGCVFERTSDSSLGITLTLGNDSPVGFVDLPISLKYTGKLNLTGGMCDWRTDKVIAAEKSLKEVSARIFAELFSA